MWILGEIVKKIHIMLLTLFFFSIFFSSSVRGGLQVWPGKITISISEWSNKNEIKPQIQIKNPYSYGVNISLNIENANPQELSTGYTNLPNLSWITAIPDSIYLPANSTNYFEVNVNVPSSKQSVHFNERWETLVVISSDRISGSHEGINVQVEITVKLFIITPTGGIFFGIQYIYILIVSVISIIIILLTLFFVKKKKNRSE
jgi:hypothetical protein